MKENLSVIREIVAMLGHAVANRWRRSALLRLLVIAPVFIQAFMIVGAGPSPYLGVTAMLCAMGVDTLIAPGRETQEGGSVNISLNEKGGRQ